MHWYEIIVIACVVNILLYSSRYIVKISDSWSASVIWIVKTYSIKFSDNLLFYYLGHLLVYLINECKRSKNFDKEK